MKKVLLALIAAAAVIAAVTCVNSCEKYILPSMEIIPDSLAVNMSRHELSLYVDSNVPWWIETQDFKDAGWLMIEPFAADIAATVKVTVEENDSGSPRSIVIPVHSQTLEKKLSIFQSAEEEPYKF